MFYKLCIEFSALRIYDAVKRLLRFFCHRLQGLDTTPFDDIKAQSPACEVEVSYYFLSLPDPLDDDA